MRPAASVEIAGLTHRYPQSARAALDSIAFSIEPGERVGLLGPNGAGKSTLMRILCGYLPVRGKDARVLVGGLDVRSHSRDVREQVGYMPELVPLYAELRVSEHLGFRAAIKGISRRHRRTEVARVASLTGLDAYLQRPIAHLSRGYRQRVGLADALLGSPALIVLDEPTVGLDPNQIQDIRAMLRDLRGQQTLVFSSHILAEVEMLCDRVLILSEGRLVANESLQASLRASRVHVAWQGGQMEALKVLARWQDALPRRLPDSAFQWAPGSSERVDVAIEISASMDLEIDAAMAALGAASHAEGLSLCRLEAGRSRLEERFALVTGGRVS